MIKLIDLLSEIDIKKNAWEPLSASEIGDIQDELFNLIQNAYANVGGHPNYNTPSDLPLEGDEFDVIDLDADPDIDAVNVMKIKPAGHKMVAMGHDGSSEAKSKVIAHQVQLLNKQGYYVEVSGKMKDILIAKGLTPITDEMIVRKVLKGKQLSWNPDGSYCREIGGCAHTKMLFGRPMA
jgi:hypothetical protein